MFLIGRLFLFFSADYCSVPLPFSDVNAVGKAFVEHYYTLFDTNRLQLADLYVMFPTLRFTVFSDTNQFLGLYATARYIDVEF